SIMFCDARPASNAPPPGVWQLTKETVTEPSEITISFEAGVPVSVDGVRMPLFELILKLNDIVGAYGYGRMDMVENRRVGNKSREVYESPAGLALIQAHSDLESVCLERDLHHYKMDMVGRYSELIYDGLWFSSLREAMDSFIDETQEVVNGDVRLGLAPGRCWVLGRRSDTGLYDYGLATYDPEDTFRHEDAEGFVRIWGLGLQTRAAKQGTK
ncbi:MAG: argininosuccinate synthase, partial [Acidimicrobiales bacterium]